MSSVFGHIRFALRQVRRRPGFAALVSGTLALGLGATTAVFSVAHAVLLRPLPFPDSDRLIAFVVEDSPGVNRGAYSPAEYRDYRDQTTAFENLAATVPWDANLASDGPAERIHGLKVTLNFFQTLGLSASRGRMLGASDADSADGHVAVVSDRLWKRAYGMNPSIVGSSIRLDGDLYTVVGVAPPGFLWGSSYGRSGDADVWAPFLLTPARLADGERRNEYLDLIGRLRRGNSAARAQLEVDAVTATFKRLFPQLYPREGRWAPSVRSLRGDRVAAARPAILLLAGAVALTLFVVAGNAAGLFAARVVGRRREIATRRALGAPNAEITMQFLAESVLTSAAGGAAGIGAAAIFLAAIRTWGPAGVPGLEGAGLHFGVIAFAGAVSLATGVAFGFVPALAARGDAFEVLRTAGVAASTAHGRRLRRWLVASQVAVALPVLVGAGLLLKSLRRVLDQPPGFDPGNVLSLRIALPRSRYPAAPARAAFASELERRVAALPGVSSAGMISELPLGDEQNSGSFEIDGSAVPAGQPDPHAENWRATPGYFRALRIALRKGRLFDSRDRADSTPVVLIDEALARRYFSGNDPIGRRIDFEGGEGNHLWREIVGVVANVKTRALEEDPQPEMYSPIAQRPAAGVFLVARCGASPASLAAPIRAVLHELDPSVAAFSVASLDEVLGKSLAARRFTAAVISAFAVSILLLAGIGIFAVTAHWVADRAREIGVRAALGARSAEIWRLVMTQAAILLGAGAGAGLVLAVGLTQVLRGQLFGVGALDASTYAAVAVLLALSALAAVAVPAWRASRIDPMSALRSE